MLGTDSKPTATLELQDLELIDAYWRAANYLSVGQIYLLDNPSLRAEHVKPRLLGHLGHHTGPELVVCTHESGDQAAGSQRVVVVERGAGSRSPP